MDWLKGKPRFGEFFGKYKYVLLVLLLGVCLMAIPGKKQTEQPEQPAETGTDGESVEEQLSRILSQIQGAGRVEVMLTEALGEQTVYQTNDETNTDQDSNAVRRETVIIANGDRGESGLVQQVNPPQYLGALVVCQGADSPAVRLAVTEAVSKVTGLGANRISVLKMK
ncbi:MAG TPA: hypothetical protein IAC31_00195 [Candidatus Faecousia intestinigallinarum]|nr:hypothetical protein [Candidatus Faecousia intestinigallinarum]